MESSPETSTRSTPDSPIIGLIENSATLSPNAGMPKASKEPTPEVPASTPSAAIEIKAIQTLLGLAVIKLRVEESHCLAGTLSVNATIYPGRIG